MKHKLMYGIHGFLFFILITSSIFKVTAQDPDSLFQKAWMQYHAGEPALALPLIIQYIGENGNNSEMITLAGRCFAATGQYKQATEYYHRALSVENSSPEIYLELGNLYDKIGMTDSAVIYFQMFKDLKPSDINGYIRMAVLMLDEGKYESALENSEMATLLDPDNPSAIYLYGMSHYAAANYHEALKISSDAISRGVKTYLIHQLRGLSYFYLADYENAFADFTQADILDPGNASILDFKAQSLLIKNTSQERFTNDRDGDIRFTSFSSGNLSQIQKDALNPLGLYNYNSLFDRFTNDLFSFGLDDFFMLYIGFTDMPEYSPHTHRSNETGKYFEEGLYEEAIESATAEVRINPTSFINYWYIANSYLLISDFSNYYRNIFKYYGFLEAIKATGNGKNTLEAFIVTHTNHEYTVFDNLGYELKNQENIHESTIKYDALSGIDQHGNPVKVYFNVDIPFSNTKNKSNGKKPFKH
jgi:tetratricopeptide (TPR) repeat protein